MVRKQIFTALSAALIVSCGDGGGGGGGGENAVPVATAPNPTPTPTTSPAPTPSPPLAETTLLNFVGSKQFDTLDSSLRYNTSVSGVVSREETEVYSFTPSNGISLLYDAPSVSRYYIFAASNVPPYNVYPNYFSAPFTDASRIAFDAAFTRYRTASRGATYDLTLLTPGAGNPRVPLYYVGVGTAEGFAANASGTGVSNDFRAFGYGFPAGENAVPSTGTGQYSGIVIGRAIELDSANVYTLSGTLSVVMNFAAQTYTGAVSLVATNDRTSEVVSLGSFPLRSIANYSTPLNNIVAYIGTGDDQFRAKLAGSTAEELEGSFTLVAPDPRAPGVMLRIVGAVAARR